MGLVFSKTFNKEEMDETSSLLLILFYKLLWCRKMTRTFFRRRFRDKKTIRK
jgi:hypothetical protein